MDEVGERLHAPCPMCPHPPYRLLAHQRYGPVRKQSDRARLDPWETPEYRRAHPGPAGARALAWLRETFGSPIGA